MSPPFDAVGAMKLATFRVGGPVPTARVGVLADGATLLDLTAGHGAVLAGEGRANPAGSAAALVPPEMLGLLENGPEALEAAREVLSRRSELPEVGPAGARIRHDLDDVSLASPLPRPNTLRDFSVFEDHGREKDDVWYELPVYYKGNPESVVPPGATVEWPPYAETLDYELEVAAVIGREARNVEAADADAYVAGYTIFDDFSARDVQRREMRAGLGPAKGKDFANGLGPYLVTADEFDPADARMVARVDGEVWSEGNLGEMYHSFGDLVEHASWGETLHPGDVLASGTVGGGCGADLGRYPDRGATVELEVEGIGTLRHRLGEPR